MADVAPPIAAAPAALLLPVSAGSTAATAQSADPFAALFATVTATPVSLDPTTAAATAATTTTTALALPAAAPIALTLPLAVPAICIAPPPAALPKVTADANSDEDKPDLVETTDDPLADAIASGATAVLAFAPALTAIAPPPPPVAYDASAVIGGGSPPSPSLLTAPQPTIVRAAAAEPTPDNSKPASDPGQATPGRNDHKDQSPAGPAAVTGAKLTAATLPPALLDGVIAALKHDGQPIAPTATVATPAPATVMAAAATQQPPPAPAATPLEGPAAARTPVGRTDEIVIPRRAGTDSRKRIDPAMIEGAPVGLVQRVDGPQPAIGAALPIMAKGDAIVEQSLSIARDGAWLDTLARDIAASAGSGADLHFKLNPQMLGSLTVAIAQSADGASIRLTADTRETRNILLDAQPRLIAEARAQGLKIADAHVDLGDQQQRPNQDAARWAQGSAGQHGGAHNGQNRQPSPAHQPFVSNPGRRSNADSESPAGDPDALYA